MQHLHFNGQRHTGLPRSRAMEKGIDRVFAGNRGDCIPVLWNTRGTRSFSVVIHGRNYRLVSYPLVTAVLMCTCGLERFFFQVSMYSRRIPLSLMFMFHCLTEMEACIRIDRVFADNKGDCNPVLWNTRRTRSFQL